MRECALEIGNEVFHNGKTRTVVEVTPIYYTDNSIADYNIKMLASDSQYTELNYYKIAKRHKKYYRRMNLKRRTYKLFHNLVFN